jgi:hypothetical protein
MKERDQQVEYNYYPEHAVHDPDAFPAKPSA